MNVRILVGTVAAAVSLVVSGCGTTPAQTALCDSTNCSGCCTPDGQCETGNTDEACGANGAACSVCISGNACVHSACVYTLGDGGTGNDGGTGQDGGLQDGGTGDGGTGSDGGPIVAPAETWTWVDFPDAVCGNDSPTGIGINPTTKSDDLLIYLQGGGACWNALTCFTIQSAANLNTGYGASQFASDPFKSAFAVDRSQATNPFKDMSYVYVPYCTGDVHAGNSVQQYDSSHPAVHHAGAANIEAYLKRLQLTFPNATHVFLSGSSAGAFGAQLNYERVVKAFPNAEVHVLADSGQLINPNGTLLSDWQAAWNLTLPAGCTGCTTDFTKYPAYLASTYPNRRFALLAFTQDSVLRVFFGYDGPTFEAKTLGLLQSSYDPYPNAKYFVLAGTSHTMLGSLQSISAPGGETLLGFVTDWAQGNAGWKSVKP